jgi:hypothetical protein
MFHFAFAWHGVDINRPDVVASPPSWRNSDFAIAVRRAVEKQPRRKYPASLFRLFVL